MPSRAAAGMSASFIGLGASRSEIKLAEEIICSEREGNIGGGLKRQSISGVKLRRRKQAAKPLMPEMKSDGGIAMRMPAHHLARRPASSIVSRQAGAAA